MVIKSYKDGNRLILVLENCTGETAIKANAFVADVMGLEIEPVAVPGLQPIKVKEDECPNIEMAEPITSPKPFVEPVKETELNTTVIPVGTYKGMDVEQAFNKDGVKAAVVLTKEYKNLPKEMQASILDKCKSCICEDVLHRNDIVDYFEFKAFVNLYRPIINNNLNQIIQMAGYSSVEDFIEFSDEATKSDAYTLLLDNLKERTA